ncbi:hypothetical protein N0M98_31100 [Paenibacillus doosanensis]|uniref:Sporulation protein n=2 Tax=Paenibacillus konkukensis TaxID=2020716 RepID=A0ABY4RTL6_9BACL|nr:MULTISPECIES: hypothetical protein [Paenibacillus]MCS7464547.1 hypothetical protein [Paenibacillus doosanensis]UQZ84868.1 hypothetical protein SK3146_04123 [Paenibacillus konkukensis]
MRPKFALPLLLGAALAVTGAACQKQDGVTKAKSYSRDGLLGMTEVNPNMPMSPTYHTYMDDARVMKATVAQVAHVTDSTIIINGPNATVNLKVPAGLSDEETARIEQDARDKLSKAMPRYTVKVSVSRK